MRAPNPPEDLHISVGIDFIHRRLGEELPAADIKGLLARLGFEAKGRGRKLNVAVPPWRATGDVSLPVDIVEEVGRLYGYENLAFHPPVVALHAAVLQPKLRLERRLREALAYRFGLQEVWSHPWTHDRYLEASGLELPSLRLAHPPSPDMARIQPSLIPQLMKVAVLNLRYFDEFGVFELARVFQDANWSAGEESLPEQTKRLGVALVGDDAAALYRRLKGLAEGLPRATQMSSWHLVPGSAPWADAAACMAVQVDGTPVGHLGVLSARAARKAGVRAGKAVALLEVGVAPLTPHPSRENAFAALPEHPEVEYDLSLRVAFGVQWNAIREQLDDLDPLLRRVTFIDEYVGPQVGEGHKSVTLRMTLGAPDRTLVGEEVDRVAAKAVERFADKLGATVRDG